jgi:hypothetical protein
LSSCCSSLLVQISVLKNLDASCNQYKPPQSTSKLSGSSPKAQVQIQVQFPQLQGCLKNIVECEVLAMGSQQLLSHLRHSTFEFAGLV